MSKQFKIERRGLFLAFLYFSCMIYILIKGFTNEIVGCGMDRIIFGMNPRQYMMIFWLPYFIVYYCFFRNDFSVNRILRKRKKKQILYEQQLKILECAVWFQFIFLGICLLINHDLRLLDWSSRKSMYYANTLQTTSLSGGELLLVVAMIGIVRLTIIGNVINLCFWYTNSLLLGNIIIIIGLVCESVFPKVQLITRWCKVDYNFFAFNSEKFQLAIYLCVIFMVITGLYLYILRKKEFF